MSDEYICCQLISAEVASPFEVFALGWYDGITSGIARCRVCDRSYHIEMVAWDTEHEVRVYGFKEISRPSFDAILAICVQPPPPVTLVEERNDTLTLRVRDALATNLERPLYIAASDISKRLHGIYRFTFSEWATLLALEQTE